MNTQLSLQSIKALLFLLIIFLSNAAFCTDIPMPQTSFLSPKDLKAWKDYSHYLRTCTAGQFELLMPAIMTPIQYQITGLKDNKCVVIQKLSSAVSNSPQIFTINCAYDKNDLATMADEFEKISTGNLEFSDNGPGIKIMEKSCNLKPKAQTSTR